LAFSRLLTILGGPGLCGVQDLMSNAAGYREMLGPSYSLVSFDPRGIGNSGPNVDCFGGNQQARTAFETTFFSEVSDASSTSLETQFASSSLFGQWCSNALGSGDKHGVYIDTPSVAQDMLSFAKAEQRLAGKSESKAEIWYYGSSYGTVLGATFASLFPMNVGRCILDGVVDAQNYYEGRWDANLFDTDAVFLKFPKYCYEGGREKCSFWGPSEQNITDRIDNLLTKIKQQPIAVAGIQQNGTTTGLATYSDLKQTMLLASYFPLEQFPVLAAALTGLESGNGSIITTIPETYLWGADPATLIKCIDSYGNYNTTSIDDFQ
jgi:pimeloyl-ACP methyl ester carboxylesterase